MWTEAQAEYLASRVLSADPTELVRILYEAALEAVTTARRRLAEGDIAGRSRAVTRAYSILTELAVAVDRRRGGALGNNLVELYDYMQRRLMEANLRQTEAPLGEVALLLTTLLEGWRQCGPPPPPPAFAEECAIREWTG